MKYPVGSRWRIDDVASWRIAREREWQRGDAVTVVQHADGFEDEFVFVTHNLLGGRPVLTYVARLGARLPDGGADEWAAEFYGPAYPVGAE